MEMLKEIIKRVDYQQNETFVARPWYVPPIECTFSIYPFDGKFMAYVSCKTVSGKYKVKFDGNSLWVIGSKPLDELEKIINDYNWVGNIQKDFAP